MSFNRSPYIDASSSFSMSSHPSSDYYNSNSTFASSYRTATPLPVQYPVASLSPTSLACNISIPPPDAPYSSQLYTPPVLETHTYQHAAVITDQLYTNSGTFIVPPSKWTESLDYSMPPPEKSYSIENPSSSYLDEIRRYEEWKRKFGERKQKSETSDYRNYMDRNALRKRSPSYHSRDRRSESVRSVDSSRSSRSADAYRDASETRRSNSDRGRDYKKDLDRSRTSSSRRSSEKESGRFSSQSDRSRNRRSSDRLTGRISSKDSHKDSKFTARKLETPSREISRAPSRDRRRTSRESTYSRSSDHSRGQSVVDRYGDNARDSSRNRKSRSRSLPKHSNETSGKRSLFNDSSVNKNAKHEDLKSGEKPKISNKEIILEKFRSNYCRTSEELFTKMEQLSKENNSDEDDERKWYRSSPAELYYNRSEEIVGLVEASTKNIQLSEFFLNELLERGRKARPEVDELPPSKVHKARLCKHRLEKSESTSDSDANSIASDDSKNEADRAMHELQRKQKHPRRLHSEMWFNTAGEMNDGPACRCSNRTKRTGIRHSVYAGETPPPLCELNANNFNKLYHYRIIISPPTNFLIKNPTIITHDDHEFLFSGFSVFSHYSLGDLPDCKVIRFNIEYTITYILEKTPLNFTVKELDLFQSYLFNEVLELVDLNLGKGAPDGCSQFHFMPRFIRELPENGCEVLSMCEVLKYLLAQSGPLVSENDLAKIHSMDQYSWQKIVDNIKGMIVTYPGKKPCSVRVDQLDRKPPDDYDRSKKKSEYYPEIVHFGIRPPEISYAGNPSYQKALRYYVKYRHLVANMAKPSWEDRRRLQEKGAHLQDMRTHSRMKRDVTVAVSSKGFHLTGLMCDIVQHAMLIPVLVCHLRFHNSLNSLEETLQYKFLNRRHLQLALTHPSYRENFGTNPDHARNSLTNCGIRQPKYGDRRIHYMNTRKRGINTLINIMSRFGKKRETESAISHNERLEFLGDAVVEFLSSIHLFKMFPSLEEGGLATYRAAIVQNQHLALLAKKLGLDKYMLYAHGSDLCHDLDLRHAMANCFEALIGALFLDGGIEVADKVFSLALWFGQHDMLEVWNRERLHPLQEQEPLGDRKFIKDFEFLQNLAKFEESIGVYFKHIRLLARAFTDRSVGFTHLTLGSNQRLEFLGDTVLQLVVSDKLYRYFPEHHEGHLSLLRSSLVNNRTQSVVCDDLNMAAYAVYHSPKAEPSTKGKADLLEAFLGAMYIDKGIEYCNVFCEAVLFPRLQEFILNQDWNDPKSKLQQCCLTLRTMNGGEPDIPIYKVIECLGPTNTRVYTVAVYFQGSRLATASGHSIQEAEMNAAKNALAGGKDLFPQLDHQKRVIADRIKSHRQTRYKYNVRKQGYDAKNNALGHKDLGKAGRKEKLIERNRKLKMERANENLPKAYKLGKKLQSESEASDLSDSGKVSDVAKKSVQSETSSSSGEDDESDKTDGASQESPLTLPRGTEENLADVTDDIIVKLEPIADMSLVADEIMEKGEQESHELNIKMDCDKSVKEEGCDESVPELETYLDPVASDEDYFDDKHSNSKDRDLEEGEIASDGST